MARAAEEDRVIDVRRAEELTNVQSFLHYKHLSEEATKQMKEVQPRVVEWLKTSTDPDEEGAYEYVLPEPVESYVRLKLLRVVKTGIDLDAVERIVKAKGLANCLKVVTIPDEEEIAKAAINGDLTEEEMAEMFPQSVSYRLMTPKK